MEDIYLLNLIDYFESKVKILPGSVGRVLNMIQVHKFESLRWKGNWWFERISITI